MKHLATILSVVLSVTLTFAQDTVTLYHSHLITTASGRKFSINVIIQRSNNKQLNFIKNKIIFYPDDVITIEVEEKDTLVLLAPQGDIIISMPLGAPFVWAKIDTEINNRRCTFIFRALARGRNEATIPWNQCSLYFSAMPQKRSFDMIVLPFVINW